MRRGLLGALAICVAAALWGLDGVVLTPRLHALDVLFVVFLLHAVPFLLMQPFLAGSYPALARLGPRDWAVLLLVSLAGGILGTFSIVKALFLVDFQQLSVVVLLQKLQPVFAITLAAAMLRERISARFIWRATLALVGAYLLTFGLRLPEAAAGDQGLAAAGWALLAAASFGSATVLGKRLLGALDFRRATFGRYGLTSAISLLLLLVTGRGLPLAEVSPVHWALILVIGLTTGSGAIFLYYYGLTRVRAVVSAICELCLPLSAVVFDYWLNRSVLGGWQWLGAILLVTAITLVSLGSGRRPNVDESGPGD
ncbi:MAG: DMT family transporter [Thermoanaerobaculia bacterium]